MLFFPIRLVRAAIGLTEGSLLDERWRGNVVSRRDERGVAEGWAFYIEDGKKSIYLHPISYY